MASDLFKEVKQRPLAAGIFDAQSDPAETGFGNYTLRKNFARRGAKQLCRRGGWERLFAEVTPYNNQDIHDQLVAQQIYGTSTVVNGFTGGVYSLQYQNYWPGSSYGGYPYLDLADAATCGYYPEYGFSGQIESSGCFTNRWHLGYPYAYKEGFYGGCNSGDPFFYAGTYFYEDCNEVAPEGDLAGYPYNPQAVYTPYTAYLSNTCTDVYDPRPGCVEAITHLNELASEAEGRTLIAATMSRIYALNQNSGNWKLLADGLGNSAYTADQCGCNDVKFNSAVMGAYILFTNGFDDPLIWRLGDGSIDMCNPAARPIGDLLALNINAAGGVVHWKGFMILYDVLQDGSRHPGKLIWSDFGDPTSWIPSDVSNAGEATVAVGERFLAAAELGNYLYLYSDRSIWRVTLVGLPDQPFSFDKIYSGTEALKYRYSLVNTGNEHIYLGQKSIYSITLHDARPTPIDWIDRVSPVIFDGMNEDDAAFGSINELKCDQVVAGYNETHYEVWFSWPTGDNDCPNMSLVLNMQYGSADLVDHGFTALHNFRPDERITFFEFMRDYGICTEQELIDDLFREGLPCGAVQGGPITPDPNAADYIWNETEDLQLPEGPNSVCSKLDGKTEDDFCRDCGVATKFVMASASDFTLKQYADDVFYREVYVGSYQAAYCAQSCDNAFYVCQGYDSVLQSGANDFGTDNDKVIKRFTVEYNAVEQSTPSNLNCYVGYSAQAVCHSWVQLTDQPLKCLSCFTDGQRATENTRADERAHYPTFYRGKYLHNRLKISGVGGGACLSELTWVVKGAEMSTSR